MSERGFIEMMLTQRKRKGQTNDDQTSRLERERERVAEWHPGVIREDHQKVPNGQTCVWVAYPTKENTKEKLTRRIPKKEVKSNDQDATDY